MKEALQQLKWKATWNEHPYMSGLARNALLGGGVRVREGIKQQRKIKKKIKGTHY